MATKREPVVIDAPAAIACITPDELAYHQKVLMSQAQAAEMARQAQLLHDTWAMHLTAKYDLPDGSRVDADGSIHRPPVDAPAE